MTIDTINWNINYPCVDVNISGLRGLQVIVTSLNEDISVDDCYLQIAATNELNIYFGNAENPAASIMVTEVGENIAVSPGITIVATRDTRNIERIDASKYLVEPCCVLWLMGLDVAPVVSGAELVWPFVMGDGWERHDLQERVIFTTEPVEPALGEASAGLYAINGITHNTVGVRGSESIRVTVKAGEAEIAISERRADQ